MSQSQLIEYILRALSAGKPEAEIRQALSEHAWPAAQIDHALDHARSILSSEQPLPAAPHFRPPLSAELARLSLGRVLLFLGGLIIILAAAIFIGVNWEQWGDYARFAAILLPALACYIAGLSIWFRTALRGVALAFLIVGAVLTPFVLAAFFAGTHLFAQDFGAPTWTASLAISFALYLILGWRFRHPLWTLLTGIGAIALVYAALLAAGVPTFDEDSTVFWWLLALSVLMMLAALGLESRRVLIDARYLYALSVALLFITLLSLTLSGRLVGDIVGWHEETVEPFGYSALVAGLVYLLLAWWLIRLLRHGFIEFPRYRGFFGFLGALGVLGGIALLGADGHYPLHETLLLIVSLGFIFVSTWRKVHSFFWLGTLFLVIYIFGMAFEYFEDQVGWPVALFAAGLVSMLVGYLIERVRRKYMREGGSQPRAG